MTYKQIIVLSVSILLTGVSVKKAYGETAPCLRPLVALKPLNLQGHFTSFGKYLIPSKTMFHLSEIGLSLEGLSTVFQHRLESVANTGKKEAFSPDQEREWFLSYLPNGQSYKVVTSFDHARQQDYILTVVKNPRSYEETAYFDLLAWKKGVKDFHHHFEKPMAGLSQLEIKNHLRLRLEMAKKIQPQEVVEAITNFKAESGLEQQKDTNENYGSPRFALKSKTNKGRTLKVVFVVEDGILKIITAHETNL